MVEVGSKVGDGVNDCLNYDLTDLSDYTDF